MGLPRTEQALCRFENTQLTRWTIDVQDFRIIREHNEEVTSFLRDRLSKLVPDWEQPRIVQLAEQIVTALSIYLIDDDMDTAVHYLERVTLCKDSPDILINAVLICRYILLAVISGHHPKPFNSLEIFSWINDKFEPFIRSLHVSFKAKIEDFLPADYRRAAEIGLLTFDFTGVGLFVLDKNLTIIHWSNGMERLLELPQDEILGQHLISTVHCLKSIFATIEHVVKNEEEAALYDQVIGITPEAELITNVKITPLRDKSGISIGAAVLIQDITSDRKNTKRLQKYERYFDNILKDAADAIVILDERDRIVMFNRAAETLFDRQGEKALGKTLKSIMGGEKTTGTELERMGEQVKKNGHVRNYRMLLEREEKSFLVEITRSAIHNEKGKIIGSSIIARDITEQEKLRQQLVQSEKLSAVGTLAAGIAHDVGTPLTSISSLVQILKDESADPDFQDKSTLIQHSIDRISRTVRTLVDFSRPTAQKIERIYLNNVIEQVIHIIKYDKRLKYQKITTDLDAGIPTVEMSFDQILQVFVNICLNAADAMEGLDNGHLHIKTGHDRTSISAVIEDNGCGITAENLPHLFEPFFTTKKQGQGTGLGLWVSYNIVKSFNGDITASSEIGKGTTFVITFPLSTPDPL